MEIKDIRILIVNDFIGPKKLTSRYLESAGFHCTTASNGQEALELMKKEWFDLIITNYHMPVMDGLTLTSYLYSNIKPKPLIILETFAWSHEIETLAIETGADECYNHNGIEEEELLDLVFSLLRRKKIIG